MSKSNITYLKHCPLPGYTGEAWNPIVGCPSPAPNHPGCKNCWARASHNMRYLALKRGAKLPLMYEYSFDRVQLFPERLDEPLHWKSPRMVMLGSQTDLFHPLVCYPNHDHMKFRIGEILNVIHRTPQHQYFVLTKYPKNAAVMLSQFRLMPNLGVLASVSDQPTADRLLPDLLRVPAAWRGISAEPLLGPIEFSDVTHRSDWKSACGKPALDGISLVIAGCESGTNRRHAEWGWFRSLRDQCQQAGTAFYLKQREIDGKVVELPHLDGRQWAEWPASDRARGEGEG